VKKQVSYDVKLVVSTGENVGSRFSNPWPLTSFVTFGECVKSGLLSRDRTYLQSKSS